MKCGGKIPAGFFWGSAGDTFDKVIREFLTRAQKAELEEKGHDCGHRFEITVRSSLHISGPGEHTDADWYSDGDRPVEVRAHNLRDALLIAATLPLGDWFDPEDPTEDQPHTHLSVGVTHGCPACAQVAQTLPGGESS